MAQGTSVCTQFFILCRCHSSFCLQLDQNGCVAHSCHPRETVHICWTRLFWSHEQLGDVPHKVVGIFLARVWIFVVPDWFSSSDRSIRQEGDGHTGVTMGGAWFSECFYPGSTAWSLGSQLHKSRGRQNAKSKVMLKNSIRAEPRSYTIHRAIQ